MVLRSWLCLISWESSFLCDSVHFRAPLILGKLVHLGVRLPLFVLVLGAEPVPKVCSGHWLRPEGTCASSWVGVPWFLDPGDPFTLGIGADVLASPVILGGSL